MGRPVSCKVFISQCSPKKQPIEYICKKIYCKELAHAIMDANKSQDLQSKSKRPKRSDGVVPVPKLAGLRSEKTAVSV